MPVSTTRQPETNGHWQVPYPGAGYTVTAVFRTFALSETVNFQVTEQFLIARWERRLPVKSFMADAPILVSLLINR